MSGSTATTFPTGVPANLLNAGATDSSFFVEDAPGNVLTVGSGKMFATLSAAIAASHDGDTIKVDAGTYYDDTADVTTKVTIEGVGGMVNLVATQPLANEKGILIIDNDVTIANISFSGAWVSSADGGNGAGIRYQGGNLTLIDDVFTGNQDGILGGPVDGLASNTITIDHSTFQGNGNDDPNSVGFGYTHNAYIGAVQKLTVTNSVFDDVAGVGHELKSRAYVNDIEDNVIYDGASSASYSIDLPNGGQDTVAENYIEKGANTQNGGIIHFGGEGFPYANSSLSVQGNTIINDRNSPSTYAVLNQTIIAANVSGNTIANLPSSQIASGPVAATNNVDGNGQALADSNANQLLPSNFTVFDDSAAHSVTLTSSNSGVEGGAGLLTVDDPAGHVTVIGGSGGLVFQEDAGAGGSTITTAAHATNSITLSGQDSVDSEGNDSITVGGGNATILVNGIAQIASGSGSDAYTVNGSAAITGNGGSDAINVTSTGTVDVVGVEGALSVASLGGTVGIDAVIAGLQQQASVQGGSVTVQNYDNELNFITSGGLGQGTLMQLGVGTVLVRSGAADTIHVGSGNATLQLAGGGQTVYAGTGQLAIFGSAISPNSMATVYGNGGDYDIDGDTGNIIYIGGSLASTVEANLSNIILQGGSGRLTINGGARETITGGSGGITLNGGAADTITTAAGSINTITLADASTVNSYGTDTLILGSGNQAVTAYGHAVITGSGNNNITVLGTAMLTTTAGADTVTIGTGAAATITTAAATNVTETGGSVTYIADGGGDQSSAIVTGGTATIASAAGLTMSIQTQAGAEADLGAGNFNVAMNGTDTLRTGAAANVNVTFSANGGTIFAGSGSVTVTNQDFNPGDNSTIYGGSGTLGYSNSGPGRLTFIGGSGDAVIDGTYGILTVRAGSGNIAIKNGSGGRLYFVAGSGKATVNLSATGGNVTFGSGTTTVTEAGYGAGDNYKLIAGQAGGSYVINGFRAQTDTLTLVRNVDVQGWDDPGTYSASGGETLTASFTDGSKVAFTGITSAAMASNIEQYMIPTYTAS